MSCHPVGRGWRRESWQPPEPPTLSRYVRLYFNHVLQADLGVDLDFLVGQCSAAVPHEAH